MLNLGFPLVLTALSLHFLQLLSKGTEMLFPPCFLLVMRPSRTVAYSHEKILFQATDMQLAEKFMTDCIRRPRLSQELGLCLLDRNAPAGSQNPKYHISPKCLGICYSIIVATEK